MLTGQRQHRGTPMEVGPESRFLNFHRHMIGKLGPVCISSVTRVWMTLR